MVDRTREHIIDVLTNSDDPDRIKEAIWDIIVLKLDHHAILAELRPEKRKRAMQQGAPVLRRYEAGEELYPEDMAALASLSP